MADVLMAFDAVLFVDAVGIGPTEAVMDVGGLAAVTLQVWGMVEGVLEVKGSLDGDHYSTVYARTNMGVGLSSISSDGLYWVEVVGLSVLQVSITEPGSSPINVIAKGVAIPAAPFLSA